MSNSDRAQACPNAGEISNRQAMFVPSSASLMGLPLELSDIILSLVIPDPVDYTKLLSSTTANQAFTHPITQTSRELRKRCFEYINRNTIWIQLHLNFNVEHPHDLFLGTIEEMPHLALKLVSHVSHLAPTITVDLQLPKVDQSSNSPRKKRATHKPSRAIVIPYAFRLLLELFVQLCHIPDGGKILTIDIKNMEDHARRDIHNLVSSALLTLRDMLHVNYTVDSDYVWDGMTTQWEIDDDIVALSLSRATCVLEHARSLEQTGHVDEAGLLLMHSLWLADISEDSLPHAEALFDAGVEPQTLFPEMASRNRLRTFIFHMQCTAGIYLHHFAVKYGVPWCNECFYKFDESEDRFMWQPAFTWFGATKTEIGKWYYTRALMLILIESSQLQGLNLGEYFELRSIWDDGTWPVLLQEALLQVKFAIHWRSWDDECQKLQAHLMSSVSSCRVAKANREVSNRLGFEVDVPALGDCGPTKWNIDPTLMGDWGEPEVMRYLPVFQQGASLPQHLMDWVDMITISYLQSRSPAGIVGYLPKEKKQVGNYVESNSEDDWLYESDDPNYTEDDEDDEHFNGLYP